MVRVESGVVEIARDPIDMVDLAASVVSAVGCRSPGRFCSPKLTAVTAVPSAAMVTGPNFVG